MNIGPLQRDAVDLRRDELAVLAGAAEKLRSIREKFRRAALVLHDVGMFMADHAVIGLAAGGERERVRRGSVEDEKHFAIRLEKVPQQVRRALRPAIHPVGWRGIAVRALHRLPRFGADPGGVVAGELGLGNRGIGCNDARGRGQHWRWRKCGHHAAWARAGAGTD
jgi:hypothetical protein